MKHASLILMLLTLALLFALGFRTLSWWTPENVTPDTAITGEVQANANACEVP